MFVSVDRGETRVALLEATGAPAAAPKRGRTRTRPPGASASSAAAATKNKAAAPNDGWRVAELYLERRGNRSIVGNIYKGKVDNVLPGLEAAFVD
ncbi:MAG: Rne/Rng family ribonuclease, partial [Conexibacter sp.]|nr:Rne/Rng family ribonuclease [Conexibacter sp.]